MGVLGATYAVHIRVIEKFIGDFLLVIIELLSLGARSSKVNGNGANRKPMGGILSDLL